MRLLLDTRISLGWMNCDPALSASASALIADPDNTIFISTVSTWEIWIKKSLGKLEVPDDFASHLANEEFEHLPLTVEQTRAVGELPWHHRDPFDRMLVAQAQATDLTLLTADEHLPLCGTFVKRV